MYLFNQRIYHKLSFSGRPSFHDYRIYLLFYAALVKCKERTNCLRNCVLRIAQIKLL